MLYVYERLLIQRTNQMPEIFINIFRVRRAVHRRSFANPWNSLNQTAHSNAALFPSDFISSSPFFSIFVAFYPCTMPCSHLYGRSAKEANVSIEPQWIVRISQWNSCDRWKALCNFRLLTTRLSPTTEFFFYEQEECSPWSTFPLLRKILRWSPGGRSVHLIGLDWNGLVACDWHW